jgi:hypothetical protein
MYLVRTYWYCLRMFMHSAYVTDVQYRYPVPISAYVYACTLLYEHKLVHECAIRCMYDILPQPL